MSLTGKLEDLAISDIFQILSIGKKTGALLIKTNNLHAVVIFKRGLVVRGESDALETSDIGQDLLKAGVIKESTLELAYKVKNQLKEKSIAEILIEMDAVKREMVDKYAKKRIENVIVKILMLNEGDFRFEPDTTTIHCKELSDPGWEVSKGLSPEYLLMEGARVYDETMHYGSIIDDEDMEESGIDPFETTGHSKDMSALMALSQELRFPESLSEVSLLVMRYASDIFKRGILFEIRDQNLYGLGQFGLDYKGADEAIRGTVLTISQNSLIDQIMKNKSSYKGEFKKDETTEKIVKILGGGWPPEVAIFPVVVEGSVKAILYCDNQPEGDPIDETPGLEIFINQAGLALEKALLKKRLKEKEAI